MWRRDRVAKRLRRRWAEVVTGGGALLLTFAGGASVAWRYGAVYTNMADGSPTVKSGRASYEVMVVNWRVQWMTRPAVTPRAAVPWPGMRLALPPSAGVPFGEMALGRDWGQGYFLGADGKLWRDDMVYPKRPPPNIDDMIARPDVVPMPPPPVIAGTLRPAGRPPLLGSGTGRWPGGGTRR